MKPFARYCHLFAYLALGLSSALAQDNSTPKTNGLDDPDLRPWHLKATFQVFDEHGNVENQGTYEKFWVGITKYKQSYASNKFTQTTFGSEKSTMQTGSPGPGPWPLRGLGIITGKWKSNTPAGECTDDNRLQFTCSNPMTYLDHAIPGDIEERLDGRLVLSAHVVSIESLTASDEVEFQPPPDAFRAQPNVGGPESRIPAPIKISPDLAEQLLIKKVEPHYPPETNMRVSGTVVLQATISRKGLIEALHVVSGPAMLRGAAMDAVRQWIYKPYLQNNTPIEVQTTINILLQPPE